MKALRLVFVLLLGCGGAEANRPSQDAEDRIARRVEIALAKRAEAERDALRRRIEELTRERDALERGSVAGAAGDTAEPADPDRPQAAGAAPAAVARVRVPASGAPARGAREPLVTVVVFSDFQCPFCSRAVTTLDRLERDFANDVSIVFRHQPLPFHPRAEEAAEAAMEARAQRGDAAFWQMHDLLFANQRALERADLERYAQQLGLDAARFTRALDGDVHVPAIESDQQVASRVGATGTPTFYLNGRQIVGAQPYDVFADMVREEVANANAAIARGTPRSALYAHFMARASNGPPDQAVQAATARRAPDPNAVYRVPVTGSAQRGSPDALATVVVFSDFQCPFCARVVPTLDALAQEYGADLRIVFRHNPLPFHARALPAAEAAMEARAQRGDAGFWQMHDLLFANQGALEDGDLERYAQQIGLDVARFRNALASDLHVPAIRADQSYAQSIGASGTPSFFVNGRQLRGAQPIEAFRALIDEVLADARSRVAAGTPRARVYETIIAAGATSPQTIPAPPTPQRPGSPEPDRVYAIAVPATGVPTRGTATAPVTVQIFSDFQCPFCARLVPTLDQLVAQYGTRVRFVWRNYPLPFHQDAMLAAEAAMEVHAQLGDAAFWRMHDLLFANQRALSRDDLERYARQVGRVNMHRFKRALDRHARQAAVQADMNAITSAGVRIGTPTLVINGRVIQGAQPIDVFQRAIDRALTEAAAP